MRRKVAILRKGLRGQKAVRLQVKGWGEAIEQSIVDRGDRRLAPEVISRITGLGAGMVRNYLALAREYDRPEHQCVLERLLLRFGPLELEEQTHG